MGSLRMEHLGLLVSPRHQIVQSPTSTATTAVLPSLSPNHQTPSAAAGASSPPTMSTPQPSILGNFSLSATSASMSSSPQPPGLLAGRRSTLVPSTSGAPSAPRSGGILNRGRRPPPLLLISPSSPLVDGISGSCQTCLASSPRGHPVFPKILPTSSLSSATIGVSPSAFPVPPALSSLPVPASPSPLFRTPVFPQTQNPLFQLGRRASIASSTSASGSHTRASTIQVPALVGRGGQNLPGFHQHHHHHHHHNGSISPSSSTSSTSAARTGHHARRVSLPFTPKLVQVTPSPFSHSAGPASALNSSHLQNRPPLLQGVTPLNYPESFTSLGLRHLSRCDSGIDSPGCTRTLFGEAAPSSITYRDVRDIQLIKVLGSGGFGTVYKGVMCGGLTVAVKRLKTNTKNDFAQMESYRAELNLLNLCHPNVVAALCAAPAGNAHDAMLVMEYVSDRNLLHIINDVINERLEIERRLRYGLQIANALSYIHSRSVIHLDVKPANILITADDACKLCDFGCSQLLVEDKTPEGMGGGGMSLLSEPTRPLLLQGTAAYRAPELLRGEPASRAADLYALGVTLWHMKSRRDPYGGENHHVIIFCVVAHGLRPDKPFLGINKCNNDNDCDANNNNIKSTRSPYNGLVHSGETLGLSLEADMVDGLGEQQLQKDELLPHPVEQLYEEVTAQCWDADANARPSAELLTDAFRAWLHAC